MYSNGNPIDGLPSKDNRKLTKEEKKALKQKQKEDEKRKKEEEKRKKEELKKKAKEEKEAKKRREKEEKEAKKSGDLSAVEKRKSVKDSLDAHTISRQGSNLSMSDGGVDSPRGGLGSSQSSVDKRSAVNGQGGTPKLTRTKSGTSGALGKVQAKKGRRPAKFKEKEFQIILDNLRQNNKQDTELDLQNHYLDKWAAEDLAEVLIDNQTVKMLNLRHNLIGDDGVVLLARVLEKNKTIHSFDISFNGLTRKGTRYMIDCLNNNVFITELFVEVEPIALGALGRGGAITPDMREELDQILESNAGFQLLLAGKSDRLELPMREQRYINTHIIDRFPGLRKIDLSKNRLREIPKEIGTLKRLEELNLQENSITSIPVEIGELPSLEVLDLCRNTLVEIPLAIANLPRLRRLLLAGNRLDNIPLSSLGGMQALEFLDIRDNPLSLLSCMSPHFKGIINQGGYETLKFIKHQNEGSEEVSA